MQVTKQRLYVASVVSEAACAHVDSGAILAYSGAAADRRRAMRRDVRAIREVVRVHGFGTAAANGKSVTVTVFGHVVGVSGKR